MDEFAYEKRFFDGYRFYDEMSGFMLSYAGVGEFDLAICKERYSDSIDSALKFMERVEAQEVVNVSEGRRVDHFNLRLGEGLEKSITIWRTIQVDVEKIKSGQVVNENNQTYTDVIVNGIGGSYLGPYMILIAKKGNDFNVGEKLPVKIHFVRKSLTFQEPLWSTFQNPEAQLKQQATLKHFTICLLTRGLLLVDIILL